MRDERLVRQRTGIGKTATVRKREMRAERGGRVGEDRHVADEGEEDRDVNENGHE